MGRNIEVKVRLRDPRGVTARVRALAGTEPTRQEQDDIYFSAPRGRLKLRVAPDGQGELIAYERPDSVGPQLSTYTLVPTDQPDALHEALGATLGTIGRVRKVRLLWLLGRTRLHLDQVDDLGAFLELEVVLVEGEDLAAGEAEASALLTTLEILPEDRVETSYLDLLSN